MATTYPHPENTTPLMTNQLLSDFITLPDEQPDSASALKLKFKYYQRLEGTIGVPAGSAVKAVTARAFESGQPNPRATRSLVIP